MRYLQLKKTLNFYKINHYNILSNTPLWIIRPFINAYYGNSWSKIPNKSPFLFVHIPKNAGSSIEQAIYGQTYGHTAAWLYAANNSARFHEMTSFAIVRNPYDRFCSIFYHYLGAPRLSPSEASIGKYFFSRYSGPDELASSISTNRTIRAFFQSLIPAIPQVNWIKIGGKIAVNEIFLFEQIKDVESFLRKAMERPAFSLPHINASERGNAHWQEELSPNAIRTIASLYAEDIRLWESLQ